MSNFVQHKPCPKCGSKDNLAEFDDGHEWCFGCGYYKPSEGMSVKAMDNYLSPKIKSGYGEMPADFTFDIPKEAYSWLKKYELTDEQIKLNKLGWSQQNEMLIFPYFDNEGKTILWQGRYFPQRKPKTYTNGQPDSCIAFPVNSTNHIRLDTLVVVEDPVSAIKVTNFVTCSPLFGAHLSLRKAVLLSKYYEHLIFWLDPDMIHKMVKLTEMYKHLFITVSYIVSDRDPKEHSLEEIKEYLDARLD